MSTGFRHGEDGSAAHRPASVRWLDHVCLVFALWTLCSITAVMLGLTLTSLLWLFAASLLAARLLPLSVWLRDEGGPAPAPADDQTAGREAEREQPSASGPFRQPPPRWVTPWRVAWIGALALATAFVVWQRPSAKVVWWCALVLLVAALPLVLRERARLFAPAASAGRERLLWLLAFACVVIALVSHRPDADDAQYVDIAASAADLTQWPLLSGDTLHGIPGLPLIQPIYRCHSYELWNGAISFLTGIPAIYCFHWISASLAALLLPLAWARLFRVLTPERWLTATAIFVFVLLAVGDAHRWHGNFALVRIWQGKALFLFIFMPLVYTYAIRFGLRPNRRDWILLCAAQIAAMGSSSSALWCAPLGAGIAFASVWRPSRKSLPALMWCGLASSVLVFAGLGLRQQMQSFTVRIKEAPAAPVSQLAKATEVVLGDGRLPIVAGLAVLAAWLCSRHAIARRLLVCMPLLFLVFLFNPYTAKLVSIHLTGPSYWRALWAVPIPLFLTFVLMAPLSLAAAGGGARRRWAGGLGVVAAAVAFAVWIPSVHALSPQNGVAIHRPGLKVPDVQYDLAQKLQASVGPRAHVLAAASVSAWIPTLHSHAYPVMVRNLLNSRRMRDALGRDEVLRRRVMYYFVSGYKLRPDAEEVFRQGLDRYRVEGVCLREMPQRNHLADSARKILDEQGFRRIFVRGEFELWTRELAP